MQFDSVCSLVMKVTFYVSVLDHLDLVIHGFKG